MKTLRRLRQRLRHVIRIELGHILLGGLEEHRLPIRSKTKYEGPIEAIKVIRMERDAIKHYSGGTAKHRDIYQPMKLSSKRWRKDSQLFLC